MLSENTMIATQDYYWLMLSSTLRDKKSKTKSSYIYLYAFSAG